MSTSQELCPSRGGRGSQAPQGCSPAPGPHDASLRQAGLVPFLLHAGPGQRCQRQAAHEVSWLHPQDPGGSERGRVGKNPEAGTQSSEDPAPPACPVPRLHVRAWRVATLQPGAGRCRCPGRVGALSTTSCSLHQGKSSSTGNLLDKEDLALPPPDYGTSARAFPAQPAGTFKQRPYSVAMPAFSQVGAHTGRGGGRRWSLLLFSPRLIYLSERLRVREVSVAGSLPRWPQWPELG